MHSLPLEPKVDKPSKFIIRLYNAVEDPEIPSIVWSSDGSSFLILAKEEFEQNVLPKISKTTEFSGFIRQLNGYDFKKKTNIDPKIREYAHPNFHKNRTDLFGKLARKSTGLIKSETVNVQNNIQFLNDSNYRLTSEVVSLKKKVEEQDKKINTLVDMFQQMVNLQVDKSQNMSGNKFQNRQLDFKKKQTSPKYLQNSEDKDDLSNFYF